MAAFRRRHFHMHFRECKVLYSDYILPMFVINNVPALVQIMAWRRSGAKPLSEEMLTQFCDAYMRHWVGVVWISHLISQENTKCV